MNGRLKIKHLDGSSLAGLEQEYTGPELNIGTSAAAHICFDADDDPGVEARHATLRLNPGGAQVVSQNSAAVLVNGEAVESPAAVQIGDTVRLGSDGPEFQITFLELPSADAPVSTVMGGRRSKEPAPTKPAATSSPITSKPPAAPPPPSAGTGGIAPTIVGKRSSPLPPGQLPPVRLDMGKGVQPPPPGSTPAPRPKPQPAKAADFIPEHVKNRPAGSGIGINTLMGVVESVSKRERGRNTARLVAVVAGVFVLACVAAVVLYVAWPEAGETTTVVNNNGSRTDWAPIAAKVKPSICVALHRKRGSTGTERVAGTVWSVGEGVFATNAHVADILYNTEMYDGETPEMVIRTPGADPKDLKVKSVVIHPGYQSWQKLLQRYNPYDPADREFMSNSLFGACDVALIYIDKSDWEHQPPPLKLADQASAEDIGAGRELATFGYPSEGIKMNTINPEPEGRYGVVSKVGDSFLASVKPKDAEFVWYNWESAGGASGSPVFNTRGEVVSLVSAGNVIGVVGQARISAGGTTLGPTVRFVKELLDQTVQEKQAERDAKWEATLEEAFSRGASFSDDLAEMVVIKTIININQMMPSFFNPSQQQIQLVSKSTGQLNISGNQRTVMINGVKAEPGFSFFLAVATNRPTPITMYPEQQRPAQGIEFPSYFYLVPQEVQTAFVGPVVVEASPDAEAGTTDIAVYVFRIIKRPQE